MTEQALGPTKAAKHGGVDVAMIGGVEVVTIPLSDFAELLACRKRLERIERAGRSRSHYRASPIDSDPELKAFILRRLGSTPLVDIAADCKKAFGDRAPSASAIHRFWQRHEAAVDFLTAAGVGLRTPTDPT